jgi:hypothetical protein
VGGLTRRLIVSGTTERAAAFDSNGGVTGWAGDASIPNLNASSNVWRIVAFEIKAAVAADFRGAAMHHHLRTMGCR